MKAVTTACSNLARISISLPESLLRQLDNMVQQRGYESRSQAIAEMIHHQLAAHKRERGQDIMAGTITLLYDHTTPQLQKNLTDIQHDYLREVISSLRVHLMDAQTLEVILVQGSANCLQTLADSMITQRGVVAGKLELTAALIPQLLLPASG